MQQRLTEKRGKRFWKGLWGFVKEYGKDHDLAVTDGFIHISFGEELDDIKDEYEELLLRTTLERHENSELGENHE